MDNRFLRKSSKSSRIHKCTVQRRLNSPPRRSLRSGGRIHNMRVNRDRVYDFYTKQAEHFRLQQHCDHCEKHVPMLLSASPELDGGQQGHFGNQTEKDWASNRWNETQLGSVQAGVLHIKGKPSIPRAVCVRLGDHNELSACFNPDTLMYEAVWSGGFVSFSSVRHGLLGGMSLEGTLQNIPEQQTPTQPFSYRGFYRHGNRVVFAYRIGDVEYLDAPWVADGKLIREVAPVEQHSLRELVHGGPAQWPQMLETRIIPGSERPFAIDTIELPIENPWKALFFCGDHDFLPDGSAMVCTMQGDVWHVTGLDSGTDKPGLARWKRFASGLHHALGLVVASDGVYVQCRDQLTRLRDLNGNGEADLYECFCNAFETSPGGHDFICGLRRDREGYFYTASSNQGLVRMSPDGQTASVVATGFRNPDGLEVLPDGSITVPCSEGTWTPASMICQVPASQQESRSAAPLRFRWPSRRSGLQNFRWFTCHERWTIPAADKPSSQQIRGGRCRTNCSIFRSVWDRGSRYCATRSTDRCRGPCCR